MISIIAYYEGIFYVALIDNSGNQVGLIDTNLCSYNNFKRVANIYQISRIMVDER